MRFSRALVLAIAVLGFAAVVAWLLGSDGGPPGPPPLAPAVPASGPLPSPTAPPPPFPAPALSPATSPAPAAPEPAPPSGGMTETKTGTSLLGVVLDERTGQPIPEARVTITEGGSKRVGRGSFSLLTSSPPLGNAVTDALGAFRVEGIPAGVLVTASAEARGHGRSGISLVLERGAASERRVEIRLPPAGVLRGVVSRKDGEPVAGATVFVLPADQADMVENPTSVRTSGGRTFQALTGTAGPGGNYEVDGLEPGGIFVALAEVEGFGRSPVATGIVVAEDGTTARTDLVVDRYGALRIRLLAPDGTVPGNRSITLVGLDMPTMSGSQPDGTCVFSPVRPGRIPIQIRAEGFLYHAEEVDMPLGEDRTVEVRLERGIAIAGIVIDDLGRPIPGVRVEIDRPWQLAGKVPPSEAKGTAGPDGRFRVEGLRTGTHVINVRGPGIVTPDDFRVEAPVEGVQVVAGRAGGVRARLVLPSGGKPPETLTVWDMRRSEDGYGGTGNSQEWKDGAILREGIAPGPVEIKVQAEGYLEVLREVEVKPGEVLDLGEILLDAGLTLEGRVTDPEGRPVDGAEVSAGDAISPSHVTTTTDRDGRFTLPHLAAGANEISIGAEGFLESTVTVAMPPEASPFPVVLRRGGVLEFRVLDATGKPAAGAKIAYRLVESEDEEREEADHRGVFTARVAPGRYRVELLADDWGNRDPPLVREVQVDEGATVKVDFAVPSR